MATDRIDKVAGRAGQAVLAICSWKAFSAYVRSSIDTTPVTYDTFWTVFMNNEASAPAMVRMIRDFSTKRGLRPKAAMGFMASLWHSSWRRPRWPVP